MKLDTAAKKDMVLDDVKEQGFTMIWQQISDAMRAKMKTIDS